MSKLFIKSKPPPEEYTEEQLAEDYTMGTADPPRYKGGQRLTIPNREVTKLAFLMFKHGSPSGDLFFRIWKYPTYAIIMSKLWGDASDLPTAKEWIEVEFDTPTLINEEVIIGWDFPNAQAGNGISFRITTYDAKADEVYAQDRGTGWSFYDSMDTTYRYKYFEA
ncbi:hypothetical protein ES703_61857 [subsurface metagenome]